MRILNQIMLVTLMNLRSVPQRLGSSFVIVIGMAGVVGVLISMLAMVGSLNNSLIATGSPDRAIVMRNGAQGEVQSVVSAEALATIMNAPGVARTPDGDAALTNDVIVAVNLPKLDDTTGAVSVRGVSPENSTVRPQIRVVEGRMFEPGLRELIVGKTAAAEYRNTEIGAEIELRSSVWRIVGVFESGDSFESALIGDVQTLMSAYQRNQASSVTALLTSPDAFQQFSDAITTDPSLDMQVQRETEYYEGQGEQIRDILGIISNVVAGIMAVGALFAALNSMYSAVSTRLVEIATLRAIGFGSGSVIFSVLAEAMLLAVAGALIGAFCAWLFFNGNTVSMGNQISSMAFEVRITPGLVALGILWACVVGFLGGFLPALRVARQPVAEALRAT
ncbi:MAG: ABC transporter permease [Gammaproteobacteria bacterium]|jgi:putative ABC transport system permease protein